MDPLYIAKPIMSDEDIANSVGSFFDEKDYTQCIDYDTDVYINRNDETRLLFSLRKNVIDSDLTQLAIPCFRQATKKYRTNNRGMASGVLTMEQTRGSVVDIVNPGSLKSQVVFADGSVSSYKVGNSVESIIAGYYDKATRHDPRVPCRTTAFTRDEVVKWEASLPLLQEVDRLYESVQPDAYQEQLELAQRVPDYIIPDTIFTTITINSNFRTACHIDKGDYHRGYSALIVCEEGEWEGCYLGFPQYGLCVDIREGDFLLMNPHEYHCNTQLHLKSESATRMSIVFYFREGMLKCEHTP